MREKLGVEAHPRLVIAQSRALLQASRRQRWLEYDEKLVDTKRRLDAEMERHKDVILLPDFVDTYRCG